MPFIRLHITQTLTALSTKGGVISDMEMLKWANSTVQRAKPGSKTLRSFKDPSITTGIFFLDLLDALRPGIVDPSMVMTISESSPYEDRRQNGMSYLTTHDLVPGLTHASINSETRHLHSP